MIITSSTFKSWSTLRKESIALCRTSLLLQHDEIRQTDVHFRTDLLAKSVHVIEFSNSDFEFYN